MIKRQPKGTPVGGQFAEGRKPNGVDLVGTDGPQYKVHLRDSDEFVESFETGGLVETRVLLDNSDFHSAVNVAFNEDEGSLLVELADGRIVSVEPGDVVITERLGPTADVTETAEARDYSREAIDEHKSAIFDAEQNVESTINSFDPDALFNSTTKELYDNMKIIVDSQKEIIFELEAKLRDAESVAKKYL
jgi:hypothetical protein